LGVHAKHPHLAGGSPAVALEDLDGRRLAGAVGPEEGEDLSAPDAQVDGAHGLETVIGHAQARDLDHIAARRDHAPASLHGGLAEDVR